jgi:hypothetical protein
MICPGCGREIADNAISCQYCGKLFVSQRARPEELPAHEQVSQLSNQLGQQEMATQKAVGFRRKQRWFFYGVLIVLFLSALALVINVYNSNSRALADLANVQVRYASKEQQVQELQKQLDDLGVSLNDKNLSVVDYQDKLLKATKSLTEVTERNKKLEEEVNTAKQSAEELESGLKVNKAVMNNLLTRLAWPMTQVELAKIPVALANANAEDTDKDGLPDELERVLGTDVLKMDSDNDGFDDKAELEGGFNPNGAGKVVAEPAVNYKNRILVVKNGVVNYIWYVAENGKRYYLGSNENEFEYLLKSPYWSGS